MRKLTREESNILVALYKKCPDTYQEFTRYKKEAVKQDIKDIREQEIKNSVMTFEPVLPKPQINISGSDEKKEDVQWYKGTDFLKTNVFKKLKQAYLNGFAKGVKGINPNNPKYRELGVNAGILAAYEYIDSVYKQNIKLNEKYGKKEDDVVDAVAEEMQEKKSTGLFDFFNLKK